MAIIDWPTTRPFAGAMFSLGLDVSESAYTGFLTGNRTRRSNLADRLRGTLTLPPCVDPVSVAAVEALLLGVRSSGDLLRMAMPHRRYPLGTLRGAPVVSASAAAGARSFSISGALSDGNLWANGSFELDANADGLADGWAPYSAGGVGSVSRALNPTYVAHAGYSQSVASTALGATSADRIGVSRSIGVAALAGRPVTVSSSMAASWGGTGLTIYVDWRDGGGGFLSASSATALQPSDPSLTLRRYAMNAVVPSSAVTADVFFWAEARPGGGGVSFFVDAAMFAAGVDAQTWPGFAGLAAGDVLSVAGNLLHVAYPGATLDDAGAGTVPLTLPLQRPLASSAAVTWVSPAGLWELDDDGLQLDYSAGMLRGGVAIPLRQVIA